MNKKKILTEAEEQSIQLYYEGMQNKESGNVESAIRCFDKAIQLSSDNFLYYVQRGFSNRSLMNFDDAIEDFEQAILLCQQRSSLHHHIPPLRKVRALIAWEKDRNRQG